MFTPSKDAVFSLQTLKAADNETLEGAVLDMQPYEGVLFFAVALKGEALNFSIKGQQGDQSDLSDAADLAGTSVAFSTTAGEDGQALLEIKNPVKRYVRAVVTVPDAAAVTPTAVIAMQYGNGYLPVANVGSELHTQPAEGTA